MSYVVEKEFKHKGLKCVVVMQDLAFRCGYVGVGKNHPLYRKKLSEHLNIKKSDINGREVSGVFPLIGMCLDKDKRVKVEAYFQVHGGLTYADGGRNSDYPVKSDLWWFGFDCAHGGDSKDFESAKKLFCNDERGMKCIERIGEIDKMFPIETDRVRSLEYVMGECGKLAEQLAEMR